MSTNGKNYPVGLQKKDGRNARFREYLKGDDIIVAPGAFDCISARLVETAGFPAVYLTGAGMSMSKTGRASCRERVCLSVSISDVAVTLKKKKAYTPIK